MKPADDHSPSGKPSVAGLLQSVLGAAFGVQSSSKYREDATHGKASVYIAAGIVFTGLFVFTVAMIVRAVLAGAGS